MKQNSTNYHFGDGNFINIKTSNFVKLQEQLIVYTDEEMVSLNIEIIADFSEIDSKYHEIFLNALSSKYLSKVSFTDNPFSECRPNRNKKRKWWQFWENIYFT